MIYKINSSDVYNAIQVGVTFIINSADGYYSLVSAQSTPEGIAIITTYEDSSIRNLMNSPDWKQPCIGC